MNEAKPEKSPEQKDEDDLEVFEAMEENFNHIVRELINDRSLDKFREEYEKLHDALVQSHEHNNVLIEKCRQLNQDILSNANKISTVLSMSQTDQRTIANLRGEFEKAWKMVEQSQARESKSKDVIIALREELQNLSTLVNQSTEIATQQEATIKSAKAAVSEIKTEITQNEKTKNEISAQVEQARRLLNEVTPENTVLHLEFSEMTKERAEIKERRKIVKQGMKDAYQGIDDTKNDISQAKEKIEELESEKEDHQQNIKNLNKQIKHFYHDAELIKTDTDDIKQRTYNKSVERDQWRKRNRPYPDKITSKQIEVEEQDQKNEAARKEHDQISSELEISKMDLEENKKIRVEVTEKRKAITKKLNDYKSQLYLLQSQINKQEMEIVKDRNVIELQTKERNVIINSLEVEKVQTKTHQQEVESVNRECSQARFSGQNQKKTAEAIDDERQNYASQIIVNETNYYQVLDDIASCQEQIDEATKELANINDDITKQNYLVTAMQSERDIASRMLQQWHRDNKEIESETQSLANFVNQLKNDVKIQDQKIVDLHLSTKILEKSLKQMEKENRNAEKKIIELNTEIVKKEHEIAQQNLIQSQALEDIKTQKLKLKSFDNMQQHFDNIMSKRQDECDVLNEKCLLIKSEMRIAEKHYLDKLNEVEQLKETLNESIERQRQLLVLIRRRDLTNNEVLRLEKELNRARSEGKALEDEAENPRNVHRWTLLEATNPEQYQLLMLREDLLQSIWEKLNKFERVRNKKEDIQEDFNKLNKKLQGGYAGSYHEDLRSTKEALKRKSVQLMNLTKKVDEKKPEMLTERDKCKSVRSLIRERRIEESEQKYKETERKMSTLENNFYEIRSPTVSSEERAPGRFIGGGFGVGAAQMTTVIPKLDFGRARSGRNQFSLYSNRTPVMLPQSARRIRKPDNKTIYSQNRNRTIMSARIPVENL